MTFTVTFDTGTFSTSAGTIGIPAIFTGTGHAFFFLFGLDTGNGRFFPNTPLDFMTLAILLFDISILSEKGRWGAGAGITPT